MTKEELLKLGLTEDLATTVLEQHTAELTAEQQRTTDLTAQLETATKNVTELTDKVKAFDGVDVEGLKKTAEEWQTKYDADTAALKVDKALELALVGAKARDIGIAKAQIDTSTLKLGDDGKLVGLDEQLTNLQTDKGFLFDTSDGTGEPVARIDTGLTHGTATETVSDAQARAVMGLPVETNGGK